MSATGCPVRKNVSSWFYPYGIDQIEKSGLYLTDMTRKVVSEKVITLSKFTKRNICTRHLLRKESRVSFSFMLTDFLNCFIFSPIRREDCGVSPEATDTDPWPGAERWWVNVQTSAVLNSLLINVLLWHFHKIVYLHDSSTVTIWTFSTGDPQRAWELEGCWVKSDHYLIDSFQVSRAPNPKKPSAAFCDLQCCSPLRPEPPLRTVSALDEYQIK